MPATRSPTSPTSTPHGRKPQKFSTTDPAVGMRPFWLVLMVSVWISAAGNVALWRELSRLTELDPSQLFAICMAMGLVITFAVAGLLSLFSWRWTLKPVITLFLLSAAFGAYFMLTYNVVIDKTMMTNALQTDMRETRDLLNWRLLVLVLLMAVLPAFLVWRQRVRRAPALRQVASNLGSVTVYLLLVVLTVFIFFQSVASVMRNYPQVRYLINPLNSFYALGVLAAKPFQRDESVVLPLGRDAKPGPSYAAGSKPPLLLLVLGETGRSVNFGINGYTRPTTPLLARENIATQWNAWSCGTSTAASVPCMFSDFGREAYDGRPANFEGLLDVLQHAGLAVLWIDNQSGCKGACDRLVTPAVDTTQLKVPGLCDGNECLDGVMLQNINERIAALPAERRAKGVVVVMHQMGSHGPAYFKRSPPAQKKFLPECTDNSLPACSRESLVNAYDNSIVYTDYFLASGIAWLKTQEAASTPAMIYVADHGESLGENNLYLHGMPYGIAPDVQKHVPWITWLSPGFETRSGITTGCLKQRKDVKVTHDNYFHSVLGIMNVQTSVYKPALDMYAPCVKAAPQK